MSGVAPPHLVVLTRKKVGHYWHITGLVNGVKHSYRMPHPYMPDTETEAEAAMQRGLEQIADYEAGR